MGSPPGGLVRFLRRESQHEGDWHEGRCVQVGLVVLACSSMELLGQAAGMALGVSGKAPQWSEPAPAHSCNRRPPAVLAQPYVLRHICLCICIHMFKCF